MSDTPRTDRVIKNCNGWHHVPIEHARELERELVAAKARIARLEEAGDRLAAFTPSSSDRFGAWSKAREPKP